MTLAFLASATQLPFTAFLNRILGGPVTALLHALGIHPHDPAAPINNFVAMQLLVVLFLTLVFVFVRSRLSVEDPGGTQHLFEGIYGFVDELGRSLIGHGHEKYTGFLMALGMFILTSNLIGLVPGFVSPTASPTVPLGCALVTWFYYHYQGIKHQGFHYIKQFTGPVMAIAPLMLVIEVVSHLARVLSLTVRLFANIFAGDMVTLAFFSLIPIGVPIVFLALHIGVSFIQTYIFVLLSAVYLGGALSEEH
ncbi:MAG: F0F1 ATP synthase subunit A [Acidobacteriota bacterium]|nr:F0F1 ATP synthase subunit A [Acidobacteriota bacterium]